MESNKTGTLACCVFLSLITVNYGESVNGSTLLLEMGPAKYSVFPLATSR